MAGLWDRLTGENSVSVHLVTAAIVLGSDGAFTNQQILDAINAHLTTPIDSAAEADLLAIKAELIGQPNVAARGVYMHRLESALIVAAGGYFTNESAWRTYLGIA